MIGLDTVKFQCNFSKKRIEKFRSFYRSHLFLLTYLESKNSFQYYIRFNIRFSLLLSFYILQFISRLSHREWHRSNGRLNTIELFLWNQKKKIYIKFVRIKRLTKAFQSIRLRRHVPSFLPSRKYSILYQSCRRVCIRVTPPSSLSFCRIVYSFRKKKKGRNLWDTVTNKYTTGIIGVLPYRAYSSYFLHNCRWCRSFTLQTDCI